MAKRKRTFGELRIGSYFWSAGIGCVSRQVVNLKYENTTGVDTGVVQIGLSYYTIKMIDKDATEFCKDGVHWFTDKEDARKCAYQLIIKDIRDKEREVEWMKLRARTFRENFLPDVDPQEG